MTFIFVVLSIHSINTVGKCLRQSVKIAFKSKQSLNMI